MAWKIRNRAYMIVGYHNIVGVGWHCLEDLETGERWDVQFSEFERYTCDDERIEALEVLAWAGTRTSKTD